MIYVLSCDLPSSPGRNTDALEQMAVGPMREYGDTQEPHAEVNKNTHTDTHTHRYTHRYTHTDTHSDTHTDRDRKSVG